MLVALVFLLALPAGARAMTIEVTNTNDSGAGSLRTAMIWANALPGFDRIAIRATGEIHLQTTLPTLETNLAIEGPGADKLAVADGCAPNYTTYYCIPGLDYYPHPPIFTIGDNGVVTLREISIANGHYTGIVNDGTLTLRRTWVRDNMERGIENSGALTVSRSLVRDNRVIGIVNSGGSVNVQQSTFTGNQHGWGSGALWNSSGGTMVVSQSTISNNRTGAISNWGTARVRLTTMSNNSGGLFSWGGTLAVVQSTLVGTNHTQTPTIWNPAENGATVTLRSTILQDGNPQCEGTVTSKGYNLSDSGACHLTAKGDQENTEPLLEPLDSYGGPTMTHALRATSPAVDAGFADHLATDQRGLARIVDYPGVPKAVGGDSSDVGAFELQYP